MTLWQDVVTANPLQLTQEEQRALDECGGYLSKCRPYLNRLQRERRASYLRIDYVPGAEAASVLQGLAASGAWTAILDLVVIEWARSRGLLPE